MHSAIAKEQFAGVPVFRHTDVPHLQPDMIYLDGPKLHARYQVAVDPLLMEHEFPTGFVMAVDGRMANVEFLKSHLKRNYTVRRDRFSSNTVFRLRG